MLKALFVAVLKCSISAADVALAGVSSVDGARSRLGGAASASSAGEEISILRLVSLLFSESQPYFARCVVRHG